MKTLPNWFSRYRNTRPKLRVFLRDCRIAMVTLCVYKITYCQSVLRNNCAPFLKVVSRDLARGYYRLIKELELEGRETILSHLKAYNLTSLLSTWLCFINPPLIPLLFSIHQSIPMRCKLYAIFVLHTMPCL